MKSFSDSYKAAGVDVTAGYRAVDLMKKHVARTKTDGAISSIGGFGGLFQPNLTGMEQPILVSGTDGVGTKLKIAFLLDKHDTIGIDCVAMCVNDVICVGAKPLFFLDYIAVGKNYPEKSSRDRLRHCGGLRPVRMRPDRRGRLRKCPAFIRWMNTMWLSFSVGLVDRKKMIDGTQMKAGDAIVGIRSSGVHSNGFSLVRKIFNIDESSARRYVPEFGKTLGEELLTPTKIYVKAVESLLSACLVKAISHITGGGFYENIPRMMTDGLTAKIEKAAVPVLPVFEVMAKTGNIPERDMFNTFNMGVGMCVAVDKNDVHKAVAAIEAAGEKAVVLGEIVSGDEGVILC